MRLLVISPTFPNEDNEIFFSIFVKEQLIDLRKNFSEIIVVVPTPFTWYLTRTERKCKNYEFENIKIYYVKYLYAPISFFRKRFNSINARSVTRFVRIKGLEFDLIHAHFTSPSGVAARALKSITGVPYIITLHENSKWFQRELEARDVDLEDAWAKADLLIRWNNDDLDKLSQYNKNTISLPIGYDPGNLVMMDRNEARASLGLSHEKKIIVAMGALIERKGYSYLLEALSDLMKGGIDFECYIIGQGVEKNKLIGMARSLGIDKVTRIIDNVSHTDKRLWLNAADVFVLPSLNESFGLVQLEAMACGTPIVATKNGGSELLVKDGVGILCQSQDSKSLASALLNALDHGWDRHFIRDYARTFEWVEINNKLIMKYNEIIGNRSGRG